METGVVYLGRDNAPVLVFSDEGGAYDLSSSDKIEVMIAGQTYNTSDNSTLFDVTELEQGRLGLRFGGSGLAPGDHKVTVNVYSSVCPNGYTWADDDDKVPLVIRVQ